LSKAYKKGTKRYFEPNFLGKSQIDFVKLLALTTSIVEQFADAFEVQTNKNQQENIFQKYLIDIIRLERRIRFYSF
jgi:hypothetical protein